MDDFAAAERGLSRAESLGANPVEIAILRAIMLIDQGRLDEAVALLRSCLERDPRNFRLLYRLAYVLSLQARYAESFDLFNQAGRLSNDPLVNISRSRLVFLWRGDPAESLAELKHPGVSDVYSAVYLCAQGDYPAALQRLRTLDPEVFLRGFINARLEIARVLEASGDKAAATAAYLDVLPDLEHYRDQNSGASTAHGVIAVCYAGLGRWPEAEEAARRYLAMNPEESLPVRASGAGLIVPLDRGPLCVLAEIHARQGRWDEALAIVRRQIKAGWWRRHDLRLHPSFYYLRANKDFNALAESAPL
jgi:tetratricopeptide (TPR) repeat protein